MNTFYHLPSQIFLGVILLLVFYRTIKSAQANKLSKPFLVLWLGFWGFGIVVLFNLDKLSDISKQLGIGRGVDLIIYLSIILIFNLIYQVIIYLQSIKRQITKVVREQALGSARGWEK